MSANHSLYLQSAGNMEVATLRFLASFDNRKSAYFCNFSFKSVILRYGVQRHTESSFKHLRWSILIKYGTIFFQLLTMFAKVSIWNDWLGSEYASGVHIKKIMSLQWLMDREHTAQKEKKIDIFLKGELITLSVFK